MFFQNWTAKERILFCEILRDPITSFMITLGQMTFKKSTKKVFEEILNEFQERLVGESFKAQNSQNFKGKRKEIELMFDIKELMSIYLIINVHKYKQIYLLIFISRIINCNSQSQVFHY